MHGTGNGKLILVGEHAVVNGHPAIAFGIERKTTVTIIPRQGPTTIASDAFDERCEQAILSVIPAQGLGLRITTDLDVGRGMGSSAALAVAVFRALGTPEAELFDAAMTLETVFHGQPSGLDVALAMNGGMQWFERGPPRIQRPLPLPKAPIVVLDTGTTGNTKALVSMVQGKVDNKPVLDEIGALVQSVEDQLHHSPELGRLMNINHGLLAQLGVSTDAIEGLVKLAKAHGAYGAKLAGAGGGGVVIALTDDVERLLSAAQDQGIRAFVATQTIVEGS